MSYEFKSFGQRVGPTSLSIRSIIDGVELEEEFNTSEFKFMTTSVSGRGAVSYRTNSVDVFGRDGEMFRGQSLDTRRIVIKAYVSADTNESYREGMSKLNALIASKDIATLKFTDDMAHVYYGLAQGVSDDGEKSNKQFVEIEFLCLDPYKYTDEKTITTTNAQAISVDTDFAVTPEEIQIVFETAADSKSFTIQNSSTGDKIVYNSPTTASSATIYIRQNEDYIGYTSSVNNIHGLNVRQSRFDEFNIKNGDRLVVTPTPKSIRLKYEGAKL